MSAFLSIRELAGVALPTGEREGIFAMLRAYFDDSGTHDGSEIIVCGGLVGTVAQWEQFERQWASLLQCPLPGKPRLSKFHLAECNARDGEFFGYSEGEQDAVIHDFRKVLIDAKLISTASAIDKKAWDELVIGRCRDVLGDAFSRCVENCIAEAIRIAGPHPEGDQIAIVLDRGLMSEPIKALADAFTYPLGRPRVVSVNFLRVEDSLPLQGADIVATESYWQGIKVLRNGIGAAPRAHLRHYLDHMFASGLIVRREEIAEMLRANFDSEGRPLGGQSS